MDFYLDTLLNFPNVTVQSCVQQSNEVYLKLHFLNEKASCPQCENLSQELHGERSIVIRDLSIFGQATYLKVPRRQFYCHDCQLYFTELLTFMAQGNILGGMKTIFISKYNSLVLNKLVEQKD